jgi:hypothetical protein
MTETAAAPKPEVVEVRATGEVFLNVAGGRYQLRPLNPVDHRPLLIKRIIDRRPDPGPAAKQAFGALTGLPADVMDTAAKVIADRLIDEGTKFLNKEPPDAREIEKFWMSPDGDRFRAWLMLKDNGLNEVEAEGVMLSLLRAQWEEAVAVANRELVALAKKREADREGAPAQEAETKASDPDTSGVSPPQPKQE